MKFRLTALLIIFFGSAALANSSLVYSNADTIKTDSIPPEFPGGINQFYEYLKTNIKFPVMSRLKGVQGKVMVRFVVDSTGQVAEVKINKGLDKYTNQEALRIIRLSPKWIPGTIGGKKVGYLYHIPVSFIDTISMAGAAVMVSGNLHRSYREIKKTDLNRMPFHIIAPDLARAIFGVRYNKKLIVFNDSTISVKTFSESHFKNTFKMLQNLDTTKVQLNVSENASSFSTWRGYLNKDSILGILVYPAASYRTLDRNKLGTITLVTKAGLDRQKKIRSDLLENIIAYRNGTKPLAKEMIVIDEYHYNSAVIFNRIDTNVIKTVNVLSPSEAIRLFGDSYKDGIIYIYTRDYQPNKLNNDRQKLLALIAQYNREGRVSLNDIILVNNTHMIDFKRLSQLPLSDIRHVNMINKDQAKAFFGGREQSGIIYITTVSNFTN